MEIRTPTNEEREEIMRLSPQSTFEGTMGRSKPSEAKMKLMVGELLAKGSRFLIASENQEVRGWILFGKRTDEFSDQEIGFIYELFVLPEARGQSIASRLMERAVEQMRQESCSEIRLNAYVENRHAIRLYERLGFAARNITMSLPL
ncbi:MULTISPECIES: GNAT family N-acetyltransferase [Paenibacillus]|uniref:GNAT family N-acetyltransferase n=1 Tax=Paenibacillus TaxID=44249 RepID=UPI000400030F|nr:MULTISPECIES: GNAT family N-acetyltransferase [Paenibacillus]KKC45943.1 acetyltransferase [Paenibacillus sp. D9]